jgi:hypothetical protein
MFLTFPERPAFPSRYERREADIKMLTPISSGGKLLFLRLSIPTTETPAALRGGE